MMAEAFLETVLQNLTSFIQNHAGLCLGFQWEMKKLSSTLFRIRALLKVAEQNKCQDEEIHIWQRKINCALYDVDDLLNGCTILALRYKNHSHSHSHAPLFDDYVLKNYECSRKIGNKMNEITEKLEKIAEQIKFHSPQDIKKKPVGSSVVLINRLVVAESLMRSFCSALRILKMAKFVDVNTPMYSDFAKEKIGMINAPSPSNNSGCSTNMCTSYLRRQEIAKGQIGTILGEAIPSKVEIVVVSKLYNNSSDVSTKIYSDGFTALNHRGISYGENIRIIIQAAAQVLTKQGSGEFVDSYALNETRIVPLCYDSNQWMSDKKKIGMILVERIDYCHSGWWQSSSMKKSTGRVTAPRTPYDLPYHDEKSHVKSIVWPIRAWLLLIAALLATITYQVPFRMGRSSSSTSKEGYLQMNKQDSIMSRAFLLFINSIVFEISVVVTLFLLHKLPLKPWPQISILAMFGSYMYSMKEISPKESLALLLFISVAFTFLAAAAKLYTLKSKRRPFAVSGMV